MAWGGGGNDSGRQRRKAPGLCWGEAQEARQLGWVLPVPLEFHAETLCPMHCDVVKSRQGQRGNTDLGRRLSRVWAPVPPRFCSALGICVVQAAISVAPGIYGGLTLCQAPLSIFTGGISFNPANGSIIIPITWEENRQKA